MPGDDFDALIRMAREARAANEYPGFLSTSEKLAVSLILNRADWLKLQRYTMIEAIERVGPRWMALLPQVARALNDEDPADG